MMPPILAYFYQTRQPDVKVRNEGNVPVAYSNLTVRYYFTADGNQPLNVYLDYAQLGNLVKGTLGKLSPAVGKADTYLELSFAGAGTLYPLSTTGTIQYRIAKADWSNFNQTNDHSYKPSGPMIENGTMTAYLNGVLVYGSEPSTASARIASSEAESALQAVILGNLVRGDAVEVRRADGRPLQLRLTNMQGHLIQEHQVPNSEAV